MARKDKEARKIAEAMRALERGDPSTTLSTCEELLGKKPRDAEVLYIKALALNALALTDRALEVLNKSLRIQSRSPAAQALVGQIQIRHGKYNEALTHFEKALKLQPGYVSAMTGKAQALQNKDEHEKALALLSPMLAKGEESDKQAHVIADCLHRAGRDADALALIEKHLSVTTTIAEHRGNLGLLAAQIHERAGEYDASFRAAVAAHEAYGMAYDPAHDTADFKAFMDVFSADRLPKLPRATHGLETPVFIVGMPRTGSTLIERIIDAHPAAHGAGESQIMHEIISELPLTINSSLPYPRCALTLRPVDVDAVGTMYVERLCTDARGATRVADKMLSNCLQLGLISLLLPDAHVIDCRRDPVNTCLSCFMARLLPGAHPWAGTLEHLGHRYRLYEQLMTHWHHVLDLKILTVPYEDLVDDQEAWSRKIIDFIGLEWDDRCLRFYESTSAVTTLSREQVKRPIYRTSLTRAERFGAHLDPLRAALAAES